MICLFLSSLQRLTDSSTTGYFQLFLDAVSDCLFKPLFGYFANMLNSLATGDVVPLLLFLLALDTLKTLTAYLGWVKPNTRLGRIVYGKVDQHVIMMALSELGYKPDAQRREVKKLQRLARKASTDAGVKPENAAEQLIVLLAKYIVYFPESGEYGGRTLTRSNFYINTMEIAHSPEDSKIMATIMLHLVRAQGRTKKPDVIIAPKGGNPLFASIVSDVFGSHLLLAKGKSDKSRIRILGNDINVHFRINYEGSQDILDSENQKFSCILMDCNTSGGSQLCDILSELKDIEDEKTGVHGLETPKEAYVLFRADTEHLDIEQKFKDRGCKLYRFFDLDEHTKEAIYNFRCRCSEAGRMPDPYEFDDMAEAKNILRYIQDNGKLYYNPKPRKVFRLQRHHDKQIDQNVEDKKTEPSSKE